MSTGTADIIKNIIFYAPPVLFSLSVHEAAHAWMAEKRGDPTAAIMGRKTISPIPHIDPIGTVILPALLIFFNAGFVFGWAKPVPVNSLNLKNPRKDGMWISLAGPASNLLVALIFAVVFKIVLFFAPHIPPSLLTPIVLLIQITVLLNLILAFFNLIPLPPLDGSKILLGILPYKNLSWYLQLERYSLIIFIVLMYTGLLRIFLWPAFVLASILLSTGGSAENLVHSVRMFC